MSSAHCVIRARPAIRTDPANRWARSRADPPCRWRSRDGSEDPLPGRPCLRPHPPMAASTICVWRSSPRRSAAILPRYNTMARSQTSATSWKSELATMQPVRPMPPHAGTHRSAAGRRRRSRWWARSGSGCAAASTASGPASASARSLRSASAPAARAPAGARRTGAGPPAVLASRRARMRYATVVALRALPGGLLMAWRCQGGVGVEVLTQSHLQEQAVLRPVSGNNATPAR